MTAREPYKPSDADIEAIKKLYEQKGLPIPDKWKKKGKGKFQVNKFSGKPKEINNA